MTAGENRLNLERISSFVLGENAVLFVGAGASTAAGLPSTIELVSGIKEAFPEAHSRTDDLVEVCQSILDCEVYDRRKLESFIRAKLENFTPSRGHYELTRYKWRAILTTNFDDLVEQAFRTSQHGRRPVHVISTDHFTLEPNILPIFKMMGSVSSRVDEPGRMVLSTSDLNQTIAKRAKWFEYLRDLIRTGTIIFVGYKGDDRIVFDVLDDVIQRDGIQNVPASYALYRKVQSSRDLSYMFTKRKIIPVECDFESFCDFLKEKSSSMPAQVEKQFTMAVSGQTISFPQGEIQDVLGSFTPLTESIRSEPAGNREDFFKGTNMSWGAFRENWDFKREVYAQPRGILARVSSELSKIEIKENRVLLMTGIPGIGKSVMLRRLAYDAYGSGYPVMIYSPTSNTFDFKVLDAFLRRISQKVRQNDENKVPKALVIFDNAASLMVDPSDVASFLASRGRPALILAAERETTWATSEVDLPFKVEAADTYSISQHLSPSEKEALVKHLSNLGFIPDAEFWNELIEREMQGSFFAAMYRLVDPARRPLGQIIRDQFLRLDDVGRQIFTYICCFHLFGLPINIELLVRACLSNNYEVFQATIAKRPLSEIVTEDEDWNGNVLYSTHNPIIARLTLDFFMTDRVRRKELYQQIMGSVHLSLPKERELVERLLIRYLGPNRNLSDFSFEEREGIFQMVCQKEPTRALLHHLGILQTKEGLFDKAAKTLNEAIKLRSPVEGYRGESTLNILTSLGNLYLLWAKEKESKSELEEAEKLYGKAEQYLNDAMQTAYPRPHPYHVMARMFLDRGDRQKENERKLDFYSRALEVIDNGRDNTNKENQAPLYEVETLVQARLRNEKAIEASIRVLSEKYRSHTGYYLYARLLLRTAEGARGTEREKLLNKALTVVDEGLSKFPGNDSCLVLKVEILKALYPHDHRKHFNLLEQWATVAAPRNIRLLFELATTSFILGYYETAYKRFTELERLTFGYRGKFRIRTYLRDDKGEKKIFQGNIVHIRNSEEGHIRVDSLKDLERNVRFRPFTCDFTPHEGDIVTFAIGFNYLHPEADDVKKIV